MRADICAEAEVENRMIARAIRRKAQMRRAYTITSSCRGVARGSAANRQSQKVGGVFTHRIHASLRPGFFQRCGVELSK